MKAGILTISDKGSKGLRTDTSGPALREWLSDHDVETELYEVIPDEEHVIADRLTEWADKGKRI